MGARRRRRFAPSLLSTCLGLLGLARSCPLLAEGTQTGVVAGVVVDSTGSGLEGVPVTLAGPQVGRTVLTDEQGRFRFPSLWVGSYRVEAELLGLTAQAEEVAVYVGRTSEVRLELGEPPTPSELPAAEERIEVVAEAPVIDKYDPRVGGSVSFEFLDRLPVARFYQSVALVLPGLSGGVDGNPNASGALRSQNLFLIDGVDTTDPTTGLFGLNLAYEAIQEVNVTTAVAPVEYGRSSGAAINVVTRSGGNDWRGSISWIATNNDWNEPYEYSAGQVAHLAPEIAAANAGPDDVNQTVALSLGGPVRRDRLWFFAAFDDAESTFLGPTRHGDRWDEGAEIQTAAAKLTWRLSPASTLVGQHTGDDARFAAFRPFNRGPSENRVGPTPNPLGGSFVVRYPGDVFALADQTQDGRFSKLQWNTAFSQNVSLELTLARQERELRRLPLNRRGLTADAPHAGITAFDLEPGDEQPAEILEFVLYNGLTDHGFERRPREQGNLALAGFLTTGRAEHELKLGVDYQRTASERRFNFPGRAGADRATGRSVEGQLFLDFDIRPACQPDGTGCVPFDPVTGAFQPLELFNFWARGGSETTEENAAAYLSDAISFGRWLLTLGLRYESLEGRGLGRLPLVDDADLAPRASLTYDAAGDGGTLFSLAWGRYLEPFLQVYLDSFGTLDAFSGFSEYAWDFGTPECFGAPADVDSPCWLLTNVVPPFPTQGAAPNPALERSSVDELAVGFERQLTSSTGVSVHFVEREWNDLWDNVLQQISDDQGNPVGTLSRVENLDLARRRYRAIQVLFQKRFEESWQLLASYTRSETLGNLFSDDGFSDFADYRDATDVNLVNRYGLAPYDRRHQAKLFAHYQVPVGRLRLAVGSALRYESGVPFQVERLDPFGRRFVTPRGSERLREVLQWDLGLAAEVRLGAGLEARAKLEALNLTDERRVLGVETLVDIGSFGLPRSIVDLQAPRGYRLTLGLRF